MDDCGGPQNPVEAAGDRKNRDRGEQQTQAETDVKEGATVTGGGVEPEDVGAKEAEGIRPETGLLLCRVEAVC